VSNFNFNPQIDLINPQNLARIKSAEINKQIQELNAKRENFVKEKTKAQAGSTETLDNAMIKAVKEQAKSKKMTFEK
jgi:hypothetical protein